MAANSSIRSRVRLKSEATFSLVHPMGCAIARHTICAGSASAPGGSLEQQGERESPPRTRVRLDQRCAIRSAVTIVGEATSTLGRHRLEADGETDVDFSIANRIGNRLNCHQAGRAPSIDDLKCRSVGCESISRPLRSKCTDGRKPAARADARA